MPKYDAAMQWKDQTLGNALQFRDGLRSFKSMIIRVYIFMMAMRKLENDGWSNEEAQI